MRENGKLPSDGTRTFVEIGFWVLKKYRICHTLVENGGPGMQFFTMRPTSLILDVEALCPEVY